MTCPPNSIPIKDALTAVDFLSKDMPAVNKKFARKELKSLLTALADTQEFIEIDTLKHFLTGFKEAVETGDASSLVTPRGLRVKRIVDVEEFIENKFFLGLKGTVWPSTMEILYDIFHGPNSENIIEVVLGGAIGIGKCACGSMRVFDAVSGTMTTLREAVKNSNPLKVPSLGTDNSIGYEDAVAFESGRKPCLRLKTDGGNTLDVSLDHPVRVRDGYVRADSLSVGDFVASARVYPEPPSCLAISDALVKFIAYMMADGGCTGRMPIFTKVDPIVMQDFTASVIALGGGVSTSRTNPSDPGHVVTKLKPLVKDWIGFTLSKEKALDSRLFNMSNAHIALFLNAFLSCDGYLVRKPSSKGRRPAWVLGTTLASEQLIDDLAFLFRRLGIVVRKRYKESKCGGKVFDAWKLDIHDSSNVAKALHIIGPLLGKEDLCLEALSDSIDAASKSNTNWDVVPLRREDLDFCPGKRFYRVPGTYYSTKTMCEIAEKFPSAEYAWLGDTDIAWERVVSTELIGEQDVYDLSVPKTENFVCNNIIVHNSMLSEMGIAYLLYKLSCYHDPQKEYGLAPGTSIYFLFQSITLNQAKKVFFNQFTQRIKQSEYFKKHFPFNREITTELQFPNSITVVPVASGDTAALGLTVFAAALDELSFMDRVENSTKSRFTGEAEYDQASSLYNTMSNRIFSRFMRKGHVPGKLFLASSANYPGDFVDKKVIQAAEIDRSGRKNHIYVSLRTTWDAWPKGTYSDTKFPVEVGDATRRSRVLDDAGDAVDPGSVIYVPTDFKDRFHADCERCLREVAGIPVGGSNSFIKQREKIHLAAKAHTKLFGGQQLFKRDSIDLSQVGANVGILINQEFLELWNDSLAEYYCHLDLALSGDSCGITVGHLGGMKEVGKSFEYDEGSGKYAESAPGQKPIIIADGVLEIVPPQADEIDLNLIGDFLEALATRINLTYVTADSYQSASILQRIRKIFNYKGKRIKAAVLSVDRSVAPYAEVKQALRDDRILFPDCEKLQTELRELEFDSKKNKIDHPPGGGKDISDSLAGVVYLVQTIGVKQRNFNSPDGQKSSFRRIRSGRAQIYK